MRGLVGIPHIGHGRDEKGADCWGIVYLAHKRVGINISAYGDISPTEILKVARKMRTQSEQAPWVNVDEEERRSMDVVLLAHKGSGVSHVGIMVDAQNMVHSMSVTDSVRVPLTHPSIAHKIVGFRRHEALI